MHVTANFSGTAHHHTTASGTVRVSRKGTPQPQTDTPCVFVHGLGGWGNYDTVNEVAPYWGMTTGSLLAYLESEGYDCYAASVGPISSAWDRACELYAQLTGTTVDYGAAHSAAHNHDRYGKTYAQPLFSGWGPEKRIHLFGHSFGGATVRLFTQIACEGIQEEIDASPTDVSPFFRGGMDSWIYSVTTLAAPHNAPPWMAPCGRMTRPAPSTCRLQRWREQSATCPLSTGCMTFS